MSNKLYRRVVQQILSKYVQQIITEGCSTNFFGVCPINYIGGLSNKLYRRLTNEFSKTKIFCFENRFSYMENECVRESTGTRNMGHDM